MFHFFLKLLWSFYSLVYTLATGFITETPSFLKTADDFNDEWVNLLQLQNRDARDYVGLPRLTPDEQVQELIQIKLALRN